MSKAPINLIVKQPRVWRWTLITLTLSAITGLWILWNFFSGAILGSVNITAETVMIVIVLAWAWTVIVLKNLVRQWDNTKDKVRDVQHTISEIKVLIKDLITKEQTK